MLGPGAMAGTLLEAYLSRIGVAAPLEPRLDLLRRIHTAHVGAIPFENIDIQMGQPIRLDLDSLRGKLIERRRGGYCFEHNSLLLAILRALGFDATPFEARVRMDEVVVRPRTHMLLRVRTDGRDWVCDVGFGAGGPLEPVPLSGEISRQPGGEYRVSADGALRVLQSRTTGGWRDQYAFAEAEVFPVDLEVANWYTSTWPESPFVRTLTAQRSTPEARYVLRYPTFSIARGGELQTRTIGRRELIGLLRDVFLIDLPAEAMFRSIDGA